MSEETTSQCLASSWSSLVFTIGTQRDLGEILEVFNGLPDGKNKADGPPD